MITELESSSHIICNPTAASLTALLTEKFSPDSFVEIKPLANMLGAFVVREVDPNA